MNDKVTKNLLSYPVGYEPDYIVTSECDDCRFAIGKLGLRPLIAICMNPSAAKDDLSDRTINRIISVSKILGMDGWIVFNIYPERATNAKYIGSYDEDLSNRNIEIINDFLIKNKITEVWGAWGDDTNIIALIKGKRRILAMLKSINVSVFYYGTLTNAYNPRHPLQRKEKWDFTSENKHYL